MENIPDIITPNESNLLNNNSNINNQTSNDDQEKENEGKEQINYSVLIKNYLKNTSHDEEYIKKLENNPDSLFENMNEQRLIIWETFLYNFSSPSRKISDCDILCALLEREDQRIILNDCKRTNCTSKGIYYKQGLNEVFGPLLLLKYKFKSFKLSKLYDIGEVFIDEFLPNYFYQKDLYSLKSSLGLFVILLKYHEPSVYNRLDSTEIMPEMYATNPLTTLMSGKLKIDLVYELWEK